MKTKEFLKEHSACIDGAKWALSIGEEMADVWDAMIKQDRHDWLLWTATRPGVFSDSILRKLACRFVRETPLADGRKVWDLLTDERSRNAVEVAESYADGKATKEDMDAAYATAYAAARAARVAAYAAAYAAAAARDTAYAAVRDAAYAAARAADAAYAANSAAREAAYAAVRDAAYAAARAADAARDAAYAAARAAVYAAADDAVAKAAQVQMIAELGNPFKKERAGR
jgi:hypothetical protein